MVRDKFHYEIWLRAILPRYLIQKVYSADVTQAVVHSDLTSESPPLSRLIVDLDAPSQVKSFQFEVAAANL